MIREKVVEGNVTHVCAHLFVCVCVDALLEC